MAAFRARDSERAVVSLAGLVVVAALSSLSYVAGAAVGETPLAQGLGLGLSLPLLGGSPLAAGQATGPGDATGAMALFEGPFREMLKGMGVSGPAQSQVRSLLIGGGQQRQKLRDESVAGLSTAEVLERSGFRYEIHNCTSVDGYVTQLVRVVNPHVKREHLRRVPVILYTGQGTSPAAFLAASLGSHGPAHWAPEGHSSDDEFQDEDDSEYGLEHEHHVNPAHLRSHQHHQLGNLSHAGHQQQQQLLHGDLHKQHLDLAHVTESNRSLAALLSNSGYDVWLVPTRGVDAQNRARVQSASAKGLKRILSNKLTLLQNRLPAKPTGSSKAEIEAETPLIDKIRAFAKSITSQHYWGFSSDEILDYELEIQLEKVRLCTKSEKLSLITYSNGGFIAFAFLASHPGYAQKHLDVIINLAPAVFVNRLNVAFALSGLLSNLALPNAPFPADQLDGVARTAFVSVCKNKAVRYSLCKLLLDTLYGAGDTGDSALPALPVPPNPLQLLGALGNSSAKSQHGHQEAQEALPLSLLHFIGRPQSAQGLRQTLQVAHANRLAHYDHGLAGNLIFYGQLVPPDYELAAVNHPRLYIMAGERDAIADPGSLRHLATELGTKPKQQLEIKAYNHLDMLAGRENALKVNVPILHILNDRYLELDYYVESGGKIGAEELHFDTSHNRLSAKDTKSSVAAAASVASYKHYHLSEQDNSELHAEGAHSDTGFMVQDMPAVDEHLDGAPDIVVPVIGTTTPPATATQAVAAAPVNVTATTTASSTPAIDQTPATTPTSQRASIQQQSQQQQQQQQQQPTVVAGLQAAQVAQAQQSSQTSIAQVAQVPQIAKANAAAAAAAQVAQSQSALTQSQIQQQEKI